MLRLESVDLKKAKVETLVIPVCEDEDVHDDETASFLAERAKGIREFKGAKGDELTFYGPEGIRAERVILAGLGKVRGITTEILREVMGKTTRSCIKRRLSEVSIVVPSDRKMDMEGSSLIAAMGEGAYLGNHVFDKYREKKEIKPLKEISFLVRPETAAPHGKLLSTVEIVCQGTVRARDWVTTPSNHKRPEQLSQSIVDLAKRVRLKIEVMDEKALEKNGCGAIMAVSLGSESRPRMIILDYKPRGATKTVALVGKGVTFDSGGINLKPGASLDHMKSDMAGAAAVAATLITAATLRPNMRVIGAIPIVENMPSGNATRPGDVIRSRQGKTIEVTNTDAEGRLILADAMSYVIEKYGPEVLIDIATLTGACAVALGEKIAGVFSLDDGLAEAILRAGERTGERCWRLPLPEDYKELLKSDIAAIRNASDTRLGGAITGALFLAEFAGETRWAHIDIAGPAYRKKEDGYCGAGGTGFGVRLLCDVLERL